MDDYGPDFFSEFTRNDYLVDVPGPPPSLPKFIPKKLDLSRTRRSVNVAVSDSPWEAWVRRREESYHPALPHEES